MNTTSIQTKNTQMDAYTAKIVEETIHNLLEENDGTFNLTTQEGIASAVNYTVDYLVLNNFQVEPEMLKAKLIRHLPESKNN